MTGDEREVLEAKLSHHFEQIQRLEQALTHRSLRDPAAGVHNERLEFLGDSVLGLVVSEALVEAFPDWDEGQLSRAKARLVSAASAESAAKRLGLGEHLRLGRGEEKTGGREKQNLLADAYEAVVGAIYSDAGFGTAARLVKKTLLDPALAGLSPLGEPDRKSALQEWLQGRGFAPAEYHVVKESGPEHRKTFRVAVRVGGRRLAESEGANKKAAEQSAAARALEILEREQERTNERDG